MSEAIKGKLVEKYGETKGNDLYTQILDSGIKADDFDFVKTGKYVPKGTFNEKNDLLKAAKDNTKKLEDEIKRYSDIVKDNEDYKEKFNQVSAQSKIDKETYQKNIDNISKKAHVTEVLASKGAKHIDLLLGKIDYSTISKDGSNYVGVNDVVKGLMTSYNDLFPVKDVNSSKFKGPDTNRQSSSNDKKDWAHKFDHIK